jgi:hypothetical protein
VVVVASEVVVWVASDNETKSMVFYHKPHDHIFGEIMEIYVKKANLF